VAAVDAEPPRLAPKLFRSLKPHHPWPAPRLRL